MGSVKRILLAEDEPDLNILIVQKLKKEGYAVDSCLDGEEAFHYLTSTTYDAAILDIMMPNMDGLALLHHILERGIRTPVLFLTARDSIEDRVAGLDAGASDYLVKPFSFQELLARIRVLLWEPRRNSNESSAWLLSEISKISAHAVVRQFCDSFNCNDALCHCPHRQPQHRCQSKEQTVWVRGCVPALTSQDTVNLVAQLMLLLLPITAVLMLIGGSFIIRQTLKPLQSMIQQASQIGNGDDLNVRIPVPNSEDEITSLAETFNQMLERIQKSFQRERQFTQDASHELRTPISVLLAQCELEEDGDMDLQEYSQAFSMIRRQAQKMHKLTEELLQLCRLESGHGKMKIQNFCLSALVLELLEEQKLLHPETYYTHEICSSIFFSGDRQLLERAVTNLLNNAWKYGKSPISIRLYRQNGQICLSIQDHGPGISPDDLDKIWERFYQADSSRSSRFATSGFGLGLPITRQIVILHHGHISAESSSENGTVFTIFLPEINS